jgi:hypothetical protein
MAFTPKDREALADAREACHRLGALETAAINDVSRILFDCGLQPRGDLTWGYIAGHADAIRDALEPFDSGVRVHAKDNAE